MSHPGRPPGQLKNRLIILLILLGAFFLRTYRLEAQSLRGDEAATVLYAALPLSDLWELSRITDPHPPLYYALLHPWQALLGDGAWVMRFAGVLASTLAVAALYGLARRTGQPAPVCLLAAALLAVNPLQLWLAQDIRSYPFFTLLGLLSSWALWHALHTELRVHRSPFRVPNSPLPPHNSNLKTYLPWLLYILLTVASLYIHYYTVFLMLFQGLFVLVNARRFWAQKGPWLVSQVIIAISIIPGLLLAYNFIGEAAGGIDKIPALEILRLASTALLSGFTLEAGWGWWLSLLLLPVWLYGAVRLLRRDYPSGTFWALFFAAPALGVIALSIDRPFFKERFLIQAQPAFELLLAAGFVALYNSQGSGSKEAEGQGNSGNTNYASRLTPHASRFKPYALPIFSVAAFALLLAANLRAIANYHTNPLYAKAPPWRLYHDYVAEMYRPGDVMLTNFPEAAVSYYSPAGLPFYVVPAERDRPVEFRLEQTRDIAQAYDRLWFLPMLRQGFDEEGEVLNWLDRHADRVDQIFFPVYHLNLYLSPPTIERQLVPYPARFAHGIRLRGYQIFDKRGKSRLTPPGDSGENYLLALEPEESFTLSLYWDTAGPTAEPYTVFVHLIAADGFNRTGQDNPPVWGSYPTTAWTANEQVTDKYTLTMPAGAPPGDHRLGIGWYQPATQQRVDLLDETGQPAADQLLLNVTIRVE